MIPIVDHTTTAIPCPSCGLDMDVDTHDNGDTVDIYFLHAEPACEWLTTPEARAWLQKIIDRATEKELPS